MPTFTATKIMVANFAVDHQIPLGCNQIHKLAERAYRMMQSRPDIDEEVILGRVFGLPDPTPREALDRIRRNHDAAARRLGLVTA